jgi:hypothetical protein
MYSNIEEIFDFENYEENDWGFYVDIENIKENIKQNIKEQPDDDIYVNHTYPINVNNSYTGIDYYENERNNSHKKLYNEQNLYKNKKNTSSDNLFNFSSTTIIAVVSCIILFII